MSSLILSKGHRSNSQIQIPSDHITWIYVPLPHPPPHPPPSHLAPNKFTPHRCTILSSIQCMDAPILERTAYLPGQHTRYVYEFFVMTIAVHGRL